MASESRHIGVPIDRPSDEVYAYASNPAHLPQWAAGLSGSIELVDGRWVAESPMGRVVVSFAAANDHGILDHDVRLPSGETVYNPMRVIADGPGCEVVFTVRRRPEMTAAEFAADAAAVTADLTRLKRVLEAAGGQS